MQTDAIRRPIRPARLAVNLATALALAAAGATAGPAPAVAGGKDVARSAALIALLAVGAALVQQNRTARAATPLPAGPEPAWRPATAPLPLTAPLTAPRPAPRPVAGSDPFGGPIPVWQSDPGQRIPAVCAVQIDGPVPSTLYADSCLLREGFHYPLPAGCAQTIRSRDWSGRVYDGACLRDAGFRTDRGW